MDKSVRILLWTSYLHVKGSMAFLEICRYKETGFGLTKPLFCSSCPHKMKQCLFLVTFLHPHCTAKDLI